MKLKNGLIGACMLPLLISGVNAKQQETLHSTSFENLTAGDLTQQKDGESEWKSLGKSKITKKYAKTGKQSLHIFGVRKIL